MSSEVIQEYLVALGFKLDEESWKKFNGGIQQAAVNAASLGAGVTAAATSVAIAVTKIARQFTDLYYVGQRTNTSLTFFRSFEYAGNQIGVSYDRARAAVESFAASTRLNPGLQGLLRSMGIDPSQSGPASNALIGKLKQQFGEAGYFVAARIAGMYGLDEATFRQLWMNFDELNKKQAEHTRRLREAGIDSDALGAKSKQLTNSLDSLVASLSLMTDQVLDKWAPTMTSGVKLLDQWAQGLLTLGKNTDGWSSTVFSVIAALGALKTAGLALSFLGFKGAGAALGAPAAAGAGLASKFVRGGGVIGGAALTVGAMKADSENGHPVRSWLRGVLGIEDPKEPAPWQAGGSWRQGSTDYFEKQGWTREQATGIAANLHAESKFNPKAVGDGGQAYGIAQWHPDRQAKFKEVFGKDIRESTLEEQLAFVNWELNNTEKGAGNRLRATKTAGEAGAAVSQYYERPRDVAGAAAGRAALAQQWFAAGPLAGTSGGSGVSISQKTDIHVSSTDPKAAAAGVLDGQARVNGDLVRNTRGAVQ